MNIKRIMKLDTTILQSNTAIDLISYIKHQREVILKLQDAYDNSKIKVIKGKKTRAQVIKDSEYKELGEDFEKIARDHIDALHRRVGRTKFVKSFVDEDEPEDIIVNKI